VLVAWPMNGLWKTGMELPIHYPSVLARPCCVYPTKNLPLLPLLSSGLNALPAIENSIRSFGVKIVASWYPCKSDVRASSGVENPVHSHNVHM